MKKHSLKVILLFMIFALASCGNANSGNEPTATEQPPAEATATEDSDEKEPETTPTTEAPKEKRELNLFTWAGMFPQEVLDDFTAQTGITINYSNFDTDETMFAKLQADQTGIYDLIIADDYIIESVIAEGLAQKLDKNKISNYGNINPLYQGQFFDKTDEYTIPHGAGIQTIAYNPATVDIEITGYADLWDESLKDSVGIIGNYRVINGMALKVNGVSYNTEDIAEIEKAGEKLLELQPNIRLIKDDSLQDDLISGEVSAAVMYTSQVTLAKLNVPELEVVFPKEGLGFGIMAEFIPHNAKNVDEVHEFMNYILDAEVGARCFEYLGFYSTNAKADELINPEYKEFLTLPAGINIEDMEMIQLVSVEAEEAHNEIWTKFKADK